MTIISGIFPVTNWWTTRSKRMKKHYTRAHKHYIDNPLREFLLPIHPFSQVLHAKKFVLSNDPFFCHAPVTIKDVTGIPCMSKPLTETYNIDFSRGHAHEEIHRYKVLPIDIIVSDSYQDNEHRLFPIDQEVMIINNRAAPADCIGYHCRGQRIKRHGGSVLCQQCKKNVHHLHWLFLSGYYHVQPKTAIFANENNPTKVSYKEIHWKNRKRAINDGLKTVLFFNRMGLVDELMIKIYSYLTDIDCDIHEHAFRFEVAVTTNINLLFRKAGELTKIVKFTPFDTSTPGNRAFFLTNKRNRLIHQHEELCRMANLDPIWDTILDIPRNPATKTMTDPETLHEVNIDCHVTEFNRSLFLDMIGCTNKKRKLFEISDD